MRRTMMTLALLALAACGEEDDAAAEATSVRTVRTLAVAAQEPMRLRRFPAVLEPPEITELAFDVGGRLGAVDLALGQSVAAGTPLARIEPTDAALRLRQSEASLVEARAALTNATDEADRQRSLAERGVVSEAARDRAITAQEQAAARLDQEQSNLDLVRESLSDTELRAPFDGIVNSIDVQAFGTVAAGQSILTLYPEDGLEATILVSYDVVSRLTLGREVEVVPVDGSDTPLAARVVEIAGRAPAVSSFPVVVALDEMRPDLRSGMAVEVRMHLSLAPDQPGLPIPLSALALNRPSELDAQPRRADVFVFEPGQDGLGTVEPRTVGIGAIVEDRVFVTEGLSEGARIVTAGVTFLHPGQEVRLEDGAAKAETDTSAAADAADAAAVPASGPAPAAPARDGGDDA